MVIKNLSSTQDWPQCLPCIAPGLNPGFRDGCATLFRGSGTARPLARFMSYRGRCTEKRKKIREKSHDNHVTGTKKLCRTNTQQS